MLDLSLLVATVRFLSNWSWGSTLHSRVPYWSKWIADRRDLGSPGFRELGQGGVSLVSLARTAFVFFVLGLVLDSQKAFAALHRPRLCTSILCQHPLAHPACISLIDYGKLPSARKVFSLSSSHVRSSLLVPGPPALHLSVSDFHGQSASRMCKELLTSVPILMGRP